MDSDSVIDVTLGASLAGASSPPVPPLEKGLYAGRSGGTGLRQRFQEAIHMAEGGTVDPTLKELRWKDRINQQVPSMQQKLTQNKYVQSVLVWIAAMLLLYLLNPPIVCVQSRKDDLDSYRCSLFRIVAWGSLAPISYLVIPHLIE